MKITIVWLKEDGTPDPKDIEDVDGWILGDPEGWFQLIFEDRVQVHRMSDVLAFHLPRLKVEDEEKPY